MLGVGRRACARVAASSAQRGHRVLDAPCLASLAELVRDSAAAVITDVTTIVPQGDYGSTRVNILPPVKKRLPMASISP